MRTDKARGLRNCNPGNIRRSSDHFQGEVKSNDREFKQFETMAHGYRAMMRILQNYQKRYQLRTIEQIIGRWAPHSENDTEAYVASVESYTGIPRDREINIDDKETLCKLVAAMSRVENGVKAVDSDVNDGYELLMRL